MNYKINITTHGEDITTLKDILPDSGDLEILFVAKTPMKDSVKAGHYFQGRQGQSFWKLLKEYCIINTSGYEYEDESLINNRCGITDIVKKPRNYSNEPSNEEYREGVNRIIKLIKKYKPKAIVFVYKKVLDKIIEQKASKEISGLKKGEKASYGFNEKYNDYFGCKVFAMPLPGVGSQTKKDIEMHMEELKKEVKGG